MWSKGTEKGGQKSNNFLFTQEISACIMIGNTCWFNGTFTCGIMPDISISHSNMKCKLIHGEKMIADDGYRGDTKVLAPDE